VVGLGNPGRRYHQTRHNAGFLALDRFVDTLGINWREDKSSQSLIAQGIIGQNRILFVKPQTFMNNSGEAVLPLLQRHKLIPQKVVVILDDMALHPGQIRIRPKGSAGGHNGLKSIIGCIGEAFIRIRLGIGHPGPGEDIVEYVLGKFPPDDWELLLPALEQAGEAVETLIIHGVDYAMNKYNKKTEA
jgi:PTH1 family peptidyl-tRNA hydrolase